MLHCQFPSRMAKIHHECFPDNARPEITRPSVSWTIFGLDYARIRSIILFFFKNKKKLLLTWEFKKVTSFLSMSIPSTLSAIHWPRPSLLLPLSNTTFEFRVGSLGGPSPSTGDQKKQFSLLGIDFWLFRSLLVQLSSSSICLPISSQVRMCVGGRGRRSYKDTFFWNAFSW